MKLALLVQFGAVLGTFMISDGYKMDKHFNNKQWHMQHYNDFDEFDIGKSAYQFKKANQKMLWKKPITKSPWRSTIPKTKWQNQNAMMKLQLQNQKTMAELRKHNLDTVAKSQWNNGYQSQQWRDPIVIPSWWNNNERPESWDPLAKRPWQSPVPLRRNLGVNHPGYNRREWPSYIPPVTLIKPPLDEPPAP